MKQKAEPVVSSFSGSNKYKKIVQKYLPFAPRAILLVLIIIFLVLILIHWEGNKPRTDVCSTSLINQSAGDFVPFNSKALASNVATIQGLPNYQHDPNCMYILSVYYINTFNQSNAQKSMKLFNEAYTNQNLNPNLLNYASVNSLRQQFTNMQKVLNQNLQNSVNLSPKPRKSVTQ
jgi:hypothetical protein